MAQPFQLIHSEASTWIPDFCSLHASLGGSCENVLDITLSLVSGNYNSGICKGGKIDSIM